MARRRWMARWIWVAARDRCRIGAGVEQEFDGVLEVGGALEMDIG